MIDTKQDISSYKTKEKIFTDFDTNHWNNGYISYFKKKGIIHGYSDGTFRPEQYISRGEMMKILALFVLRDDSTERADHSVSDVGDMPTGIQAVGMPQVAADTTINSTSTSTTNFVYTYDHNGNMLSDGKRMYVYNSINQLVEVRTSTDTIITKYAYDILGNRVWKEASNAKYEYFYAGQRLISEYTNDTLTKEHVYGYQSLDDILYTKAQSAEYYYIKNTQGSVRHVTDTNGNTVESYEYTPYGVTLIKNSTTSPLPKSLIGNEFMYTGQGSVNNQCVKLLRREA